MKTLPPLRPKQKEILDQLAKGNDCIGLLPTGYGKSLCYLFPVVEWHWTVWVVSPLVSLIEDQSNAARALGISCFGWSYGMDPQDRFLAQDELMEGKVKLHFLSPERLVEWEQSGLLAKILNLPGAPHLVVIDEMHCLEEWRGFRFAYQNIFCALKRIKANGARMLGLTATMQINESINWMNEFCPEVKLIAGDLGRENIHLKIVPLLSERELWSTVFSAALPPEKGTTTIFYASSRREVEETFAILKMAGLDCRYFHAGTSREHKTKLLTDFRHGNVPCLVTTSAFGMGIDFPRVRKVVHLNLPYSVESYWQEVGRAGRDGLPCEAILLWRRSEVNRLFSLPKRQREKFYLLWKFLLKKGCRKQALAEFFHMQEIKCNNCDACESSARKEKVYSHRHRATVWWTEPESEPEKWLEKKYFEASENS